MTIDQIRTFLTVLTYGNITAAADHLYITQSNVSKRIASLEDELGVKLFIRHKGYRNVELTSHGEAFVPIASQWAALYTDTINLKKLEDICELTIASVDTVNNYTLVPFFHQFMEEHLNIQLFIQTFHSNEIHTLVESRTADVGFVYSQLEYPDIITTPIFRELMYLVCRQDSPYYDGIDNEALDVSDEIHLTWFGEYESWYQKIWGTDKKPRIRVNTGSMLRHYFTTPKSWAIAPKSMVSTLSTSNNLVFYSLKNPPPPRICYQLVHKYPRVSRIKAIETFTDELSPFIMDSKDICIFTPSMLL